MRYGALLERAQAEIIQLVVEPPNKAVNFSPATIHSTILFQLCVYSKNYDLRHLLEIFKI